MLTENPYITGTLLCASTKHYVSNFNTLNDAVYGQFSIVFEWGIPVADSRITRYSYSRILYTSVLCFTVLEHFSLSSLNRLLKKMRIHILSHLLEGRALHFPKTVVITLTGSGAIAGVVSECTAKTRWYPSMRD